MPHCWTEWVILVQIIGHDRRPDSVWSRTILAVLGLAAAVIAWPADGAELADSETRACQHCHGLPDWRIHDPVSGNALELSIDSAAYLGSSHGELPCRTCHEWGYDKIPHTGAGHYPIYLCVVCHDKDRALESFHLDERKTDLRGSVHGATDDGPLDCHSCHDPHDFRPINDSADALKRIEQSNAVCLRCHGRVPRAAGSFVQPDAEPFHGHFPNPANHLRKIKCVACHTAAGSATFHDIKPKEQSVDDCGQCHTPTSRLLDAVYGAQRPGQQTNPGEDAYVIGSTRSPRLERLSQILFAILLGAIAMHAIARVIPWQRSRRQRSSDERGPDDA